MSPRCWFSHTGRRQRPSSRRLTTSHDSGCKGKKAGVAPAVPFSTYHQSRSRAGRDGAIAACPEGSHQRTLPFPQLPAGDSDVHGATQPMAPLALLVLSHRIFAAPQSFTIGPLCSLSTSRPAGMPKARPEQFVRRPTRTWHLTTLPVTCLRQRHETAKIPLALLIQSPPLSIHTPFVHTRPHNSAIRDS